MPEPARLKLVAYALHSAAQPLRCAPRSREWMESTRSRYAYRCLPLTIANQHGWEILCPHTVHACWDGGAGVEAIEITTSGADLGPGFAMSHFGHGILTFSVGYLFRTPPGQNLWVRGPINRPKPDVVALEGIVETDWSYMTFTMNWQLTAPHRTVTFEEGEPYCCIVPIGRGALEAFDPEIVPVTSETALRRDWAAWKASRRDFIVDVRVVGSDANQRAWQRDYTLGRTPDGETFADHQTTLDVRPFAEPER